MEVEAPEFLDNRHMKVVRLKRAATTIQEIACLLRGDSGGGVFFSPDFGTHFLQAIIRDSVESRDGADEMHIVQEKVPPH
jgi:hypothetical protein